MSKDSSSELTFAAYGRWLDGAVDFIRLHWIWSIVATLGTTILAIDGIISASSNSYGLMKWLVSKIPTIIGYTNSPYFPVLAWVSWLLICLLIIALLASSDRAYHRIHEQARQQQIDDIKNEISVYVRDELKPLIDRSNLAARYVAARDTMNALREMKSRLDEKGQQITNLVHAFKNRQEATDNPKLRALIDEYDTIVTGAHRSGFITASEFNELNDISEERLKYPEMSFGHDVTDESLKERYQINAQRQTNQREFFKKREASHEQEFAALRKSFEQ